MYGTSAHPAVRGGGAFARRNLHRESGRRGAGAIVKKTVAVLKREYFSAVRKKMFIFMTLFFPLLMAGLMFVPIMMMAKSFTGKRVAVVDGTGRLASAFAKPVTPVDKGQPDLAQLLDVEYVDARAQADIKVSAQPYLSRLAAGKQKGGGIDAVLVV